MSYSRLLLVVAGGVATRTKTFNHVVTRAVAAQHRANAVAAANDGLANAVITALKAKKLQPIPVSGQDATAQGVQNIISVDRYISFFFQMLLVFGVGFLVRSKWGPLQNLDDAASLLTDAETTDQARAFARRAAGVVAAGRPPCPFCGGPLDPEGHICPRSNGYRR